VVFITVQNLAGIAAVALIIQMLKYFARLAGRCLFTPHFGGVLGVKIRDNGHFLHFYPSTNAITRYPVVTAYETN